MAFNESRAEEEMIMKGVTKEEAAELKKLVQSIKKKPIVKFKRNKK